MEAVWPYPGKFEICFYKECKSFVRIQVAFPQYQMLVACSFHSPARAERPAFHGGSRTLGKCPRLAHYAKEFLGSSLHGPQLLKIYWMFFLLRLQCYLVLVDEDVKFDRSGLVAFHE
jgi:hypothetical protein